MKRHQKLEFTNDSEKTAYLQNLITGSGIEAAKDFIAEQTGGNQQEIAEIEAEIAKLDARKQQLTEEFAQWGKLMMQAGQNVMREQMKAFGIQNTPEAAPAAAAAPPAPGKRMSRAQMQELTDKTMAILSERPGIGKPEIDEALKRAGFISINVSQLLSKLKKEGRIVGKGGKRDMVYRLA